MYRSNRLLYIIITVGEHQRSLYTVLAYTLLFFFFINNFQSVVRGDELHRRPVDTAVRIMTGLSVKLRADGRIGFLNRILCK